MPDNDNYKAQLAGRRRIYEYLTHQREDVLRGCYMYLFDRKQCAMPKDDIINVLKMHYEWNELEDVQALVTEQGGTPYAL